MLRTSEKKERALGIKLGLKPYRCESPKCVMVRRPHRPGVHGKARRRAPSEYGAQLLEKQKLSTIYGVKDGELRKRFDAAKRMPGSLSANVLALLERRLDNAVFRLGLAASRVIGRQLVSHGHIFVNGKKTRVPSHEVKVNDRISISPGSAKLLIFGDLGDTLKKKETPVWLAIDSQALEGKVLGSPVDVEVPFDINAVVDYYSK